MRSGAFVSPFAGISPLASSHLPSRANNAKPRCVRRGVRHVRCQAHGVSATPRAGPSVSLDDATIVQSSAKGDSSGDVSASSDWEGNTKFTDLLSAGLQAVLEDLLVRPDYYVNVGGACLGILLVAVVLSATMNAVNNIPVVPDMLRVIGLLYCLWFLATFLLSPPARKELKRDIDEFVDTLAGTRVYSEG